LKPLADQGNPEAEFELGFFHVSGAGVGKDPVAGAAWNRKAVAQGYGPAKAWLLLQCMGPDGGPATDCAAAVADLHSAAERGNPKAQLQLGSF
jgi:hypothetical protein